MMQADCSILMHIHICDFSQETDTLLFNKSHESKEIGVIGRGVDKEEAA
jgi:hypothetical protein